MAEGEKGSQQPAASCIGNSFSVSPLATLPPKTTDTHSSRIHTYINIHIHIINEPILYLSICCAYYDDRNGRRRGRKQKIP